MLFILSRLLPLFFAAPVMYNRNYAECSHSHTDTHTCAHCYQWITNQSFGPNKPSCYHILSNRMWLQVSAHIWKIWQGDSSTHLSGGYGLISVRIPLFFVVRFSNIPFYLYFLIYFHYCTLIFLIVVNRGKSASSKANYLSVLLFFSIGLETEHVMGFLCKFSITLYLFYCCLFWIAFGLYFCSVWQWLAEYLLVYWCLRWKAQTLLDFIPLKFLSIERAQGGGGSRHGDDGNPGHAQMWPPPPTS